MKKYITVLFFLLSVAGYAKSPGLADTISYWKVYNGSKLLMEGNGYTRDIRIILTKGKIKAMDTLRVQYFDDTPCPNCKAVLTIRNERNKELRKIDNSNGNYNFNIRTTDLQVIAAQSGSAVFRFYYKEDSSGTETLLFEIEIR